MAASTLAPAQGSAGDERVARRRDTPRFVSPNEAPRLESAIQPVAIYAVVVGAIVAMLIAIVAAVAMSRDADTPQASPSSPSPSATFVEIELSPPPKAPAR